MLRDARRRAGLSLRELADRAGTSHPTLAAYEAGRIRPRVDTYRRVLEAAGFVLEMNLVARVDVGPQRERKGRELEDALLLAAQYPSRHQPRLQAPVFPRRTT